MWIKGEGFTGTIIKDTWTTARGVWEQGQEVGRTGVVGRGEGKRQKTVLEQQYNSKVFNINK